MSGHTPGPWHVGEIVQGQNENELLVIEVCHYEDFANKKREYVVAHTFGSEAEASAELIASAPDLAARVEELEAALRAVLTIIEDARGPIPRTTGVTWAYLDELERLSQQALADADDERQNAT